MSEMHTPEYFKTLGKNDLIRYIVDASTEHGIDWSAYGSLTRKKLSDLIEIAQEVADSVGELTAQEASSDWYEDESETAQDADETWADSNGDALGKEEDWEYDKPNKPRWMEDDSGTALEDVEVNDIGDLEEFADVAEVVAAVIAKPSKNQKVAKEPKPKKEKAVKEPKGPRQRTFTAEQIQEMIQLVEEAKWKKSKVAEKFECSSTFIHNVIVGNVYRDVTGRGKAKSE